MTPGHVSSPNRRGRSVVDSIIMIAFVMVMMLFVVSGCPLLVFP